MDRMLGVDFKIKSDSFFQPNSGTASLLYKRALELAALDEQDTLLDLYAGTGTIGIIASKFVKKVISVELVPSSVIDANDNIRRNEIQNMEVLEGDVGELLSKLPQGAIAIVDPPRVGLSTKAISELLALEPKKIIYISCNPKTQKENVEALIRGGYIISAISPVDQFPHTPHIENIVAMSRKV